MLSWLGMLWYSVKWTVTETLDLSRLQSLWKPVFWHADHADWKNESESQCHRKGMNKLSKLKQICTYVTQT